MKPGPVTKAGPTRFRRLPFPPKRSLAPNGVPSSAPASYQEPAASPSIATLPMTINIRTRSFGMRPVVSLPDV